MEGRVLNVWKHRKADFEEHHFWGRYRCVEKGAYPLERQINEENEGGSREDQELSKRNNLPRHNQNYP